MLDASAINAIADLTRYGQGTGPTLLTREQVAAARRGHPILTRLRNSAGDEDIVDLSKHVLPETKKTGTITVRERDDFIAAVNEHKRPETRIFAEITETGATFTALVDFHGSCLRRAEEEEGAGTTEFLNPGLPGLNLFKITYTMEYSIQWKAWMEIVDKLHESVFLGEWIENHEVDFTAPKASVMATIALTLRGTENSEFRNITNLANGNVDIAYKSEANVSAGDGKLEVPQDITITIPVFLGEAPIPIALKFRYRLRSGRADLGFAMPSKGQLVLDAVKASRKSIATETNLPVWHGHFAQ